MGLLHIFYTEIAVSVRCNLCTHNLQFFVPRIKNPLDKMTNLICFGTKTILQFTIISIVEQGQKFDML